MLLGTSKICITPPIGTWMAGYGFRTKPCESISEDIFVRVHVHCQEEKTLVYIYADLAEWDNVVVASARRMLKERYGLPKESLFFMASHTHCGPVIGHDSLLNNEVQEDPAYTGFVLEQVVAAVGMALKEQVPVTMTRYNGFSGQNVFRRTYENGEVIMAPNYDTPADRNLTVLVMRDEEDVVRGIMVHYPCHANLAKGYSIHGDYPGSALRLLDEMYPNALSIFMQGCTGDLRPNSVCGDSFVPASYEEVLAFAQRFVDNCQKAIHGRGIPVEGKLSVVAQRVELPLEHAKTNDQLRELKRTGSDFEKMWASKVLERGNHPYETLELNLIRYGSGLSIYTLNAEVVQSYAAYARLIDPDAISTAYTNGMIGYLPNAQEIVEGGYEPKDSAPYFALAGTYKVEIDRLIREAMEKLSTTF